MNTTVHRQRARQRPPGEAWRDLLIVAIPPVAVVASAPSIVATFLPPLGGPLVSIARYLPLLLAGPLLFHGKVTRLRFSIPMVAWSVAAVLSIVVPRPPEGWGLSGAVAMFAIYMGPWVLASITLDQRRAKMLLRAFSLMPVAFLGLAILAQITGFAPLLQVDGASGSLRLGGIMIPAAWATLGLVGALAAMVRALLGGGSAWPLLATSLSLIAMAQGRGAGLAVAIGMIPVARLAMHRHVNWRAGRYVLRMLALVAVGATVAMAAVNVINDRQTVLPVPIYLSHVVEESDPSSGRGEAWGFFLDRWQEQPLLGHGASSVYLFSQSTDNDLVRNHFKAAHNEYVQVLVEFGIVGLLLIGGAIVAETSVARRVTRPELKSAPLAIVGAFAMFAFTDNATSPIFAVAVAMLLSIVRHLPPDGSPPSTDPLLVGDTSP